MITVETALQIAVGAAELLGADVTVATTARVDQGLGRTAAENGLHRGVHAGKTQFLGVPPVGDPPAVVAATSRRALRDWPR